MTDLILDDKIAQAEAKGAYGMEQMITGFTGVLSKPTQHGLRQFFDSHDKNHRDVRMKQRETNSEFEFLDLTDQQKRYSGYYCDISFPNPENWHYDHYLGNLRGLEFDKGISLLSTPQIEKILTQLHEVWIGLRSGQIGDRKRDNIECALNYVGGASRDLAREWKKRVPQGSSAGLALLRKFYPDAPDNAILRIACCNIAIYKVPREHRSQAIEYYKEHEPVAVCDSWLQDLLGDPTRNELDASYFKDPYRVGLLLGNNAYETMHDFRSSKPNDADDAFCSTLRGIKCEDLPILKQWINDLGVIEEMLQIDLTELERRGILSSPSNKRQERKYLPTVPRLALYCQTAHKILTGDQSWKDDVHRVISQSSDKDMNNYVLDHIGRLVVALAPEEAKVVADRCFQEMLTYPPETRVDFFDKLETFDYAILVQAAWNAIEGEPLFVHLRPMVLQIPAKFLNKMVHTEAESLYDEPFSWQLIDSVHRCWQAEGKINIKDNSDLADFIASKTLNRFISIALSSRKEWIEAGIDEPVRLGTEPIDVRAMENVLEINNRNREADRSVIFTKLRLNRDCWKVFDLLADMRTQDIVQLIDNLYAKYWVGEAETMMCANAKTGECFWVSAKNGESIRNKLGLIDQKYERYNLWGDNDGYLTSLPFFTKLGTQEIKTLIGKRLPEQGNQEYYVLPMNPIIREIIRSAYTQILRANPVVFEKEIAKMFRKDDSVPLSVKFDLLGACRTDEYAGSLRELSYLRGQLGSALKGLGLTDEEIKSFTDPLLPEGFGMTNAGSLMAKSTPIQYYTAVKDRINAILLPLVRTKVVSQAEMEVRRAQIPVASGDSDSGEVDYIPVRQKRANYPIRVQLADDMRLGSLTPMAQITMLARTPGGDTSSVHKKKEPLSSLLVRKPLTAAAVFPFPEEIPTQDIQEKIAIYGLRALQINHMILLLREGQLPDHFRRIIYPETDSYTDCLMPDYKTVSRPVQHDLFAKFENELRKYLFESLNRHPELEKSEEGKGGGESSDRPKIYFFPATDLPQFENEFKTITTGLDHPTLETEMASFSELPAAKITMVSLPALAGYVVDKLEKDFHPEEIARLFEQLHPRINYWLFSREPSQVEETSIKWINQNPTDTYYREHVLNLAESNLDVILRSVLISNSGQSRFTQFIKALDTDKRLKGFILRLLQMIKTYVSIE